MTADQPLPEGWVREFEGARGAEYFHEPRRVSVQVLPRYDPPGGRASESEPTGYLIRLQRPYSDRLGRPIEVDSSATFPEAIRTARAFMQGFSERYAGHDVRRAAAETLAAVAGYSDDRLVDLVVDRTGTRPLAVVHVDPEDGRIDPVHGVEDPSDTVGGVPVGTLCEQVRRGSDQLGSATGSSLRATVTVTDASTVVWIDADDGGTLIALDPEADVSIPDLVVECRALLDRRSA